MQIPIHSLLLTAAPPGWAPGSRLLLDFTELALDQSEREAEELEHTPEDKEYERYQNPKHHICISQIGKKSSGGLLSIEACFTGFPRTRVAVSTRGMGAALPSSLWVSQHSQGRV
jgi:hypothetical protein